MCLGSELLPHPWRVKSYFVTLSEAVSMVQAAAAAAAAAVLSDEREFEYQANDYLTSAELTRRAVRRIFFIGFVRYARARLRPSRLGCVCLSVRSYYVKFENNLQFLRIHMCRKKRPKLLFVKLVFVLLLKRSCC